MKTKLLTILLTLGLLTIVGGAVILSSQGQKPIGAAIKFDPKFIDWDGTPPSMWEAYVRPQNHPARDVDPSTVMFEGSVPSFGGYIYKGALIAQFDGPSVFNVVAAKVGHMGVSPGTSTKTPFHFWFTVTGNLLDGTPFAGEGWIAVRFPEGPPPPPPPPP